MSSSAGIFVTSFPATRISKLLLDKGAAGNAVWSTPDHNLCFDHVSRAHACSTTKLKAVLRVELNSNKWSANAVVMPVRLHEEQRKRRRSLECPARPAADLGLRC